MATLTCLVFAILAASCVAVIPTLPPFRGYPVFAQWNCVQECSAWELLVSRVDPEYRVKGAELHLVSLLPPAPVENTTFKVLTAYNDVERTFYVAALQNTGSASVWSVSINGSVSGAAITATTTFAYPNKYGTLLRMHSIQGNAQGSLILLFQDGSVAVGNPTTGKVTSLTNLITAANLTNGMLTLASAMDTTHNTLYQLASDEGAQELYILAVNVVTGALVTKALVVVKRPAEKWGSEVTFHAVWIPSREELAVFNMAVSPLIGFDQIIMVNPSGAADYLYFNLLDAGNIGFNIDLDAREDDSYQTGCWDAATERLYFGAAVYAGDDDGDRTNSLTYANFNTTKAVYVDVAVSPMNTGYMGYYFIAVQ